VVKSDSNLDLTPKGEVRDRRGSRKKVKQDYYFLNKDASPPLIWGEE